MCRIPRDGRVVRLTTLLGVMTSRKHSQCMSVTRIFLVSVSGGVARAEHDSLRVVDDYNHIQTGILLQLRVVP